MSVTDTQISWLLLIFSLPARRASQRVEVWRKLQRYGALALPSSGYVLPNSPVNREKLEWLANAIRNYKGQASVVEVQAFDNLPDKLLRRLFADARERDYQRLLNDLKKITGLPHGRRPPGKLARLRRRFQEVVAIDFFKSPLRTTMESLLALADEPGPSTPHHGRARTYHNRVWVTRLKPGIDRVSSAWLIRRFIDPKARFVFSDDRERHPLAIPFDMFGPEGFGHRGEDCTFETLCKGFPIKDARVKRIAQIIHDADLEDEKFGRAEGLGLDRVLQGWAQQDIDDNELLRRGMQLIEGLYHGLS